MAMTESRKYETAEKLVGYVFKTGWKVLRVHQRKDNGTGGIYSMCFDVEKDGEVCFMKALDFDAHMRKPEADGNPVKALEIMTSQYNYEYELSEKCKSGNLDRIVCVIDKTMIS